MLGYIFLFFIGYYFYRLAENYNKNKWLFAFVGLVCYYGTTFVISFIYGFIYEFTDSTGFDLSWVTLIPVGLGILTCIILFQVLDYKWKKEEKSSEKNAINEIGKNDR